MTKTHSWWFEMLYVSQTMLLSKLISYQKNLGAINNTFHIKIYYINFDDN